MEQNLPITLQAFFRHSSILRLSFCDFNIIGAYVAGVCVIVTIFGHQNELSDELLVHILYFEDQDEAMIIHSYISTFTGYLFSPPDFGKTNSLNQVITNT